MGGHAFNWARTYARRAEKVGWDVKLTANGHYRVTTPSGDFKVYSASRSSRAVQRQVEGWFRSRGLDELEAKLKERDKRRRLKKHNSRYPTSDELVAASSDYSHIKFSELQTYEDERVKSKEKDVISYTDDRGVARDVLVVERAPAMVQSPVMPEPRPMNGGQEVLLENGAVVYQCVKTAECRDTFPSALSLRSHISGHSRRENRQAEEDAAASAAKIVEKNRPRKTSSKKEVREPESSPERSQLALRLTTLAKDVDWLRGELENLAQRLRAAASDCEKQDVSPELREKAAKYDQLREMLG